MKAKLFNATKAQADLQEMNTALLNENETITNDFIRLQTKLQEKDFNHERDMKKANRKSHEAGQASVVGELGRVWTSNEFAAELMYGSLSQSYENRSHL